MDTILQRISRVYAAIDDIEEDDPNKLRATVVKTDKFRVVLDFLKGFSDEDLSNYAHMVIHNIANLRDHLRKWAAHNGHDATKVDHTFKNSLDLKIITDLSDNDKHGYPPRNGGESQKCPQLVNITRIMELKTQAKKGATMAMTLGTDGVPKFFGDGTAKAIITGDVVDNNNNCIGDLHEIATKAVEAWEQLLADFGLIDGKE
jgi:hypothetical protein